MWHAADRRGKTRLVILLAVMLAIAAPALWIWTRPDTQPGPSAGQAVAESFLRDIQEGRSESAWESTTAEFKSAQGRDRFVRGLKSSPLQGPFDFVSLQTVTVHDAPRSEYLFRAKDGPAVRIVLNQEAGTWKVDRWTREQ